MNNICFIITYISNIIYFIIILYADDIVILEISKNEIINISENLINFSTKMGRNINEGKTKYRVLYRNVVNKTNIKIVPYYFEQMENFKYLGININDKNNMHNEIQISAANHAYFAMNKMLSSNNIKNHVRKILKFYKFCYLHPVVMYACET